MAIIHKIILFSNYFFLIYLIVYATYILICSITGSVQMYRRRRMENLHNILEHDYYYPMSILVPAYNEEITIVQTVSNLVQLDYKLFEIVVIDDGSKDKTKQVMIDKFGLVLEVGRPIPYKVKCNTINEVYSGQCNGINIIMISKNNGGCKADAINAGINIATYPYIVNMDGDEILQKDALKLTSQAIFESDNVICVGGNLKMSNYVKFNNAMPVDMELGKNLIVDMQVLEYGRTFVGTRIFQNTANMNLIVSGGYGIFKKSALIEVGGFDAKSMGEDMEMTVRLHKHFRKNKKKYLMKYVPNSVCWTQGPSTLGDLKKQRERWYCGLLQTYAKYKTMMFNPKYGLVGMFMLPYVFAFELLNPFLMIWGWFVIAWTAFDKSINFPYVLYIFIMYFVFGIILSLVSFLDDIYTKHSTFSVKKLITAFYTAVIDTLFFRLYLSIISFLAIFKMRKLSKRWESPKRVVVDSTEEL